MYKNYHPVSSIPLEEHHASFSTLSPLSIILMIPYDVFPAFENDLGPL